MEKETMKIESQYKEKHSGYSKPMCSIQEVIEEDMIAASPETPPNIPENLIPPTSETDETTNPNPAKRYPSFNAWTTWD